ncbi:MAG TPA: hypothetical protein VF258_09970 [Luteolibacter sp.]
MKTTFATTLITLAFALAGSGLQATEPPPTLTLTEKFNSTPLDPATWYVSKKGKGRLVQKNGKLNFVVGSYPGNNNLGAAELICQYPGYDEAWELTVALTNASGSGKNASCGVMICHAEDRSDYFYLDFNGLSGVTSGMYANGRKLDGSFDRKSSWKKARIRIQYANQLMKFSISPTGEPDSWLKIGTFSPTAASEKVPAKLHANWRMRPTDTFGIQLFGFADSTSVRAGKITLDNFSLSVTR